MSLRASIAGLIAAIALCFTPALARQMWQFPGANQVASVPSVPQPHEPDDVVGLGLQNNGGDRASAPVTFGQVFAPGAVPKGAGLVARFKSNQVPVQMDVKATNPDGSVRMAVLTFMIPALAAGDILPVMLAKSAHAPDEPLQSTAAPNLVLTLDIRDGKKYSFDVADLLARALKAGRASYWLKGPQVAEVRLDQPVTGSLHVTFDIRHYATGDAVTDVEFKNDYTFQPEGGPLTYDVTIQKGGDTQFSASDITQPQYTQWHKKVVSGNASDLQMIFDLKALEKTGAILDYDPSARSSEVLVAHEHQQMKQEDGFGILGNAGLTLFMPMTGGRPDIGPTTQANTLWLVTQDPAAAAYAIAQGDAAGSIPWHFFDPKIGNYREVTAFPKLVINQNDQGGLTQALPQHTKTCNCWGLDVAHEPDVSFIPYLMTGSRYYLDQIEAQATWNIFSIDPHLRGGSAGLVVSPDIQVRGQAWALRTIINAAWILPDADPLKSYFLHVQQNNFTALKDEIAHLNEGEASGWFPGYGGGKNLGNVSPWEQDYFAIPLLLALKRDVPLARDLIDWQIHFIAGRFLAGDKGFPPLDGAGYRITIWVPPSPVDNPIRTWKEIAQANAAAGWSGGGTEWAKNTSKEYVLAARGVLAETVNLTGSPVAKEAHEWLAAQPYPGHQPGAPQDPTWDVGPNP